MLSIFLTSVLSHVCNHDIAQMNQPIYKYKFPETREATDEAKPLKIQFNLVGFGNNTVNQTQRMFDDVSQYISNLLSVTKQPGNFELKGKYANGTDITGKAPEGVGLYITAETYSATDTSTSYISPITPVIIQQDADTGRPIEGYLNITTLDTDEYNKGLILHSVLHILGVSTALFPDYINKTNDNKKYDVDKMTCKFEKHKKNFTFLITPGAHQVAVNKFGTETFSNGAITCPAGIELESSPHYTSSHPESLIYYTDLMTVATYFTETAYFRITDASLSFLEDSGWYTVNFTMGKPLLWLNKKAIDDVPHSEWATEPLLNSKTLPENYFINVTDAPHLEDIDYANTSTLQQKYYVGFDYKFASTFYSVLENMTNISVYSQKYYNPNNSTRFGLYEQLKYQPINQRQSLVTPIVCNDSQAVIPGIDQYFDDGLYKCVDYTCNGISNFTLKLDNTASFMCESYKQNITITKPVIGSENKTFTITCPDPARFCRSMNLFKANFTLNPFTPERPKGVSAEEQEASKKGLIIGGVILLFIIVIVTIVAFFFIWRWIKRKQQEEDMRRFRAIVAKVKAKKRSATVAQSGGTQEGRKPLQPQPTGKERQMRSVSMAPTNPIDGPGARHENKTNERMQQILFLQQLDKARDYQKVDDEKGKLNSGKIGADMLSHGAEPGEDLDDVENLSSGSKIDSGDDVEHAEDLPKPNEIDDSLVI